MKELNVVQQKEIIGGANNYYRCGYCGHQIYAKGGKLGGDVNKDPYKAVFNHNKRKDHLMVY